MRRLLLMLGGWLSMASSAHASGVFLKWDACHADGGVSARSFACDTNSGFEALVCSVVLDTALADVTGLEARIVGQSVSGALPAWWDLVNPGTCRPSAASILTTPAGPVGGCPSPFGGQAVGAVASYKTGVPSAGGIQLRVAVAVPDPGVPLSAGQEYFLFALRISHVKTVGAGACPGCADPMCLGLGYLQLITSITSPTPGPAFRMDVVPIGQGHLVSWQNGAPGGVYAYQINPPFGHEFDFAMTCSAVTPVRQSTWGAVKSLYR